MTVRSDPRFDMDQVVERWDDNADLLKLGSGALLHGLLDVIIVTGHFETIQHMDDVIESFEDGLFDDKSVTREIQQRTYRVSKELVELRRVILPMRDVVNAVQRHHADDAAHTGDLDGWYADLDDHVLRASEWTESLRDMVTTVFETNLSPAGCPTEHGDEEAHQLGGNHRCTHGGDRVIRPERGLPRFRPALSPDRQHHCDHSA